MNSDPQLLIATVMHKRHYPTVNQFTYRLYYLVLPIVTHLTMLLRSLMPVNRFGLFSFYERDHGDRQGGCLKKWVEQHLASSGFQSIVEQVMLVAMPRTLGYGFNPVSFWLCLDRQRQLRAVLCEVNNTFGESHCYFCAHRDRRVILPTDVLGGDKAFHVSPFFQRSGAYQFRFALPSSGQLRIWIDYLDADGQCLLSTALVGRLQPLTKVALWRAFLACPLVALKAIGLIHWQALKLVIKGIRYIPKPGQRSQAFTTILDHIKNNRH